MIGKKKKIILSVYERQFNLCFDQDECDLSRSGVGEKRSSSLWLEVVLEIGGDVVDYEWTNISNVISE